MAEVEGSKLFALVKSAAITPAAAKQLVASLREACGGPGRGEFDETCQTRTTEHVADKLIARYAKLAAASGVLTALPGIVPGAGTIVAVGAATADAVACMKLQVDLCFCLAEAFGHDIGEEESQQLAFLVAGGTSLEQAGKEAGVRIASKAGVRLLRQYLKGAALQAIKEIFKRLGITFTRKALEKALPFGIGVVIGGSANYALTRYVGREAKAWFVIDRDLGPELA